jgi:hypothetical protein
VPTRHQLAFHVLRDRTAVPALEAMAVFAQSGFADGVGAVSPSLYWMRGGGLERLSRVDDDGALQVDMLADLADVLTRLSGE